jgi:hypothetical protein
MKKVNINTQSTSVIYSLSNTDLIDNDTFNHVVTLQAELEIADYSEGFNALNSTMEEAGISIFDRERILDNMHEVFRRELLILSLANMVNINPTLDR